MVNYSIPMFRHAPFYLSLCHAKALGDANQLQPLSVPWTLPGLHLNLVQDPFKRSSFRLQYAMAVQLTSPAQHPSSDIPEIPVIQGLVVHNPNG